MSHPNARNLALALFAAALLAAPAGAAEPIGFLAVARGDVQVQSHGTNSFALAVQDSDVFVGDTIRTGLDSQAKVILADDTTLSIDEDTEITIQSLHVGAAATRDRSIIRQTRGRLRTVVGSAFGGQTRMEIHTPTAVVGVKGTDLTSEKDEESKLTGQAKEKGEWLFCLNDGKIVVRAPNGVGTPKPGNCVYAYTNGDISEEMLNTANEFSVAFSTPNFNTGDILNTNVSAPPGGGGGFGGDGYTDGTGTGGGGPGGGGGGGEGGDEFGLAVQNNIVPETPDPPMNGVEVGEEIDGDVDL